MTFFRFIRKAFRQIRTIRVWVSRPSIGFKTPWLTMFVFSATSVDSYAKRENTSFVDYCHRPVETHYRRFYGRHELFVVVPHDNWLHEWYASADHAGMMAAVELYYELCGGTDDPRRTLKQLQRRAYWRAFLPQVFAYWYRPLMCYLCGHQWTDAIADAENGTEDVECRYCGYYIHAQF